MLNVFVILIVVILIVAGAVILRGGKSAPQDTREEYLTALARTMEGEMTSIDGEDGSFRVSYILENESFIYEDRLISSFRDKVNKGYLKLATGKEYTLIFRERKKSHKIRSNIFIASQVPNQQINPKAQLVIPKILADFDIDTNNIEATNAIVNDAKVVKILSKYKSQDHRGYPFMSVKVLSGDIILEFNTSEGIRPQLKDLQRSPAVIEDHSRRLLILQAKIRFAV